MHTSSYTGIEVDAPRRDTVIADAFDAISRADATSLPFITDARKYPVKVSPAAVVSTGSTL